MFKCDCGGVLLVVAIEEPPEHLSEKEKLVYNRVWMLNVKNAAGFSILSLMMMVQI